MQTLSVAAAATILGVSKSIKAHELKRKWRKLARTCHPDLFPNDPEKATEFKRMSMAYETLIAFDDLTRAAHEIDSDVLDDDIRFMLKRIPQSERQHILRKLAELEEGN